MDKQQQLQQAQQQQHQVRLDAIKAFEGKLIDDHRPDGGHYTTDTFVVFVAPNGVTSICPVRPGSIVCLNPVTVDPDGVPHLGRSTVGGNVDLRQQDLSDAIKAYNDSGAVGQIVDHFTV